MFHDLTRVAAIQLGSNNQLQTKPVSETSGQFQHMSVTYFAVHVLKCTDTYVQAHITFFDIMVILWNGCIFLYIALIRLLVYLNWVNLLYRSVWPHCPYMVQCNTVYLVEGFLGEGSVMRCMRGISRYAGSDTPAVYLKGATSFQKRLLQATDLDARTSRVNALHSLCQSRIVMEYY